jgi:hypothetical protein
VPKRQYIERIFNRGLNIVDSRARVARGQSVALTNWELLANSIKRRLGKKAAYQPVSSPGTRGHVSCLKRFYHLSTGGVKKALLIAYVGRMYVASSSISGNTSEWDDDSPGIANDETTNKITRIYPPNGGFTPSTLPPSFGSSSVLEADTSVQSAIQSRQWLYLQNDFDSGDDTDELAHIPLRTACDLTPNEGNSYGTRCFAHGLWPPASLDIEDTESSPVLSYEDWEYKAAIGGAVGGSLGTQLLAVDSDLKLHAVTVSSTDIYYNTKALGAAWGTKASIYTGNVDSGINAVSVAVDLDDNVFIAFNDSATNNLKVISNETGAWVEETIDSAGSDFTANSLVVNKSGRMGVLYFDATNNTISYKERVDPANGTWSGPGTISVNNVTDAYVAGTVDSTGVIHAVYIGGTMSNDIVHRTRDAGADFDASWNSGTIVNGGSGTYWGPVDVDVDSDDNPAIIAQKETSGPTYTHAIWRYDGSSWSEVDTAANGSTTTNDRMGVLCFDREDTFNVVHYAYANDADNKHYYVNNASGAFVEAQYEKTASINVQPVGIIATPSFLCIISANTGGNVISSYLERVYYHYKLTAEYDDGKLGESGPSAAVRIYMKKSISAGRPHTITLNPADDRYNLPADATKIHVYRTVEGAAIDDLYYRAGSVDLEAYNDGANKWGPQAVFSDNVPDETLVQNIILNEDVFMPPKYMASIQWKDRVVIGNLKARDTSMAEEDGLDVESGGYHPNRIRFSKAFTPDRFAANSFIDVDIGGESATVRTFAPLRGRDALLCFLEDDTILIKGDTPGGERGTPFRPENIPSGDGTAARDSVVVDGEGNVFTWTKTGVQAINSSGVRYITENTIAPLWNALNSNQALYNRRIDMDYIQDVAGVYVPGKEVILWTYRAAGGTAYNNTVLCLDLRRWRAGGRREDGWSIFTGWAISKWCVWQGEGDRFELFGGESQDAAGPWVYRCLYGNDDETGTTSLNTVSTSQITAVLKTGAFDFGRSDRVRKFRDMVINAKADADADTSLAVYLDINDDSANRISVGTWDPTGGTLVHLTSKIPRGAIGTYGGVDIASTDQNSPEPWELYSIGLETQEMESRASVGT